MPSPAGEAPLLAEGAPFSVGRVPLQAVNGPLALDK